VKTRLSPSIAISGLIEAGRTPGYARAPIVARLDATIVTFKPL
jgi:hypothetical protein